MQGRHEYTPELFSMVSMESLIPQNHLLRRIDREIDFSFVRELTQEFYKSGGRPSIDPEIFFRMQLIGYLYGIRSDRRLCEEVAYNLAYRWFCGLNLSDTVPDHSSMTVIRDRFGEKTFESFFKKVVQICIEKNLISDHAEVGIDSSLIRANANKDRMVRRDGKETPKRERKENSTHVSPIDPDATLASKKNSPHGLYYKAHVASELKSGVIVDTKITSGSDPDPSTLEEQITRMRNSGVNPSSVSADRAYGTRDAYKTLEKNEITAYIRPIRPVTEETDHWDQEFDYSSKEDAFICKRKGKKLTAEWENKNFVFYTSKACQTCAFQSKCFANQKKQKKRLVLSVAEKNYLHTQAYKDPENTTKYLNQRMAISEGVFASLKALHCGSRMRYRGLWKCQIQGYMMAAALNIKKLASRDLIIWLQDWVRTVKLLILKIYRTIGQLFFLQPEIN